MVLAVQRNEQRLIMPWLLNILLPFLLLLPVPLADLIIEFVGGRSGAPTLRLFRSVSL